MSTPTRVLLLGGGYATLHAYAALMRRVGRRVRRGQIEIVVISADTHHRFHGFTGELLAGMITPERVATPLTEVLPHARVVIGRVTRVDPARQTVAYETDAGSATVVYDHVLVATGAREPVETVPGLGEHGWALRSPDEIERLASALAREPGSSVVVIGGGIGGAELATALADGGHPVTLVHSGHTVAQEWSDHPRLLARVERELAASGVDVRLGTRADRVAATSVELSDATSIPARHVIATLGQRPVVVPGLERFADSGGRLRTERELTVCPGVWAAGDAAAVAHPRTGAAVPANALWAIKGGDHVGRGMARVIAGRRATPFRYRGLGRTASFGWGRGISELYGIGFGGATAWMLRLVFFLRFMPSPRRAAGVVADLVRYARRPVVSVPALRATPRPA